MSTGLVSLCRDCATFGANIGVCPTCGSGRLISHPELEHLSIAHVDCDAFFASVEKRDDPSLAAKPVIVGGGRRGVVSTCCYIARTFGVRSAMPMFKALELCPHATVVKPRFDAYQIAARQIREAMEALTPLVQPISIDEAFLDLTGTEKLHGIAPAGALIRLARTIEDEVGITVSVGLSHNKFLAKLASDLDKPRGFSVIGQAETLDVLAPLPVTKIFGVGPAMAKKLERQGYTQMSDLQAADDATLLRQLGENGLHLGRLARGEDHRRVSPEREAKSISSETTFHSDTNDRAALEKHIYRLSQSVARRAKRKEIAGTVVTLKLKTSGFRSFTKRQTLAHPTNLSTLLNETSQALLRKVEPRAKMKEAYRLVGVGISGLVPADSFANDFLFAEFHEKIGRREDAIDSIRDRFGDNSIGTLRDRPASQPQSKD